MALRPWRRTPGDVAALVAAWADPAVAQGDRHRTGRRPPRPGSPGAPARSTPGWRSTWWSAAGDDDEVLGEVGLRNVDRVRAGPRSAGGSAPPTAGRGRPRAAVRLLAAWALGPPCGLARCGAGSPRPTPASAAVARRAGRFTRLGIAAGTEVWARRPVARALLRCGLTVKRVR